MGNLASVTSEYAPSCILRSEFGAAACGSAAFEMASHVPSTGTKAELVLPDPRLVLGLEASLPQRPRSIADNTPSRRNGQSVVRSFSDVASETAQQLRRASDLVVEMVGQHELEVARAISGLSRPLSPKKSTAAMVLSNPWRDSDSPLGAAPLAADQVEASIVMDTATSVNHGDYHVEAVLSTTRSSEQDGFSKWSANLASRVTADLSPQLQARAWGLRIREGYEHATFCIPDEGSPPGPSAEASRTMKLENENIISASVHLGTHPRGEASYNFMMSWSALHPDAWIVTIFEICGVLALMWDTFALPWYMAMYIHTDTLLWSIAWVPRTFWVLDMMVHFGLSFRKPDLELESRLKHTALHYLKRWFVVDLAFAVVDLAFAWVSSNLDADGVGVIGSPPSPERVIFSFMLCLFVIRMVRQTWRIPVIVEKCRIMSGSIRSLPVLDICLILWSILALNHIWACAWVLLGEAQFGDSDTGDTWVVALQDDTYTPVTRWYTYYTALHWAFTQMCPGSMEVSPRSTHERRYTVFVLMLGMVVGPTLTATIVSMMTEKRLLIQDRAKRFLQLRHFLRQEKVDASLALAINRQVKERRKERRRIPLGEVQDLTLLSKRMHAELIYAMYGRHLLENPVFHVLDMFDNTAIVSICSRSIVCVEMVGGDILFEKGQNGDSMYFVHTGSLRYEVEASVNGTTRSSRRRLSGTESLLHGTAVACGPGAWCSEMALWVHWSYIGSMRTSTTSDLLRVGAKDLQAALGRHPNTFAITCDYCRAFILYYAAQVQSWTDLGWEIDHDDVFLAIRYDARIALAEPMLALLQRSKEAHFSFLGSSNMVSRVQKLREEIAEGACFISVCRGEVVRTVSVVALRAVHQIEGQEARCLVQIGTKKRGNLKAAAVLPGGKRQEQEGADAAMLRHMDEHLSALSDPRLMNSWDVSQNVAFKDSPTYGIRTRYVRTMFEIDMDNSQLKRLQQIKAPGHDWDFHEITDEHSNPRRSGLQRAVSTSREAIGLHLLRSCELLCNLREKLASCCRHRKGQRINMKSRSGLVRREAEAKAKQILQEQETAVVSCARSGTITIYLWLTESQFSTIADDHCKRLLASFVDALQVDTWVWET